MGVALRKNITLTDEENQVILDFCKKMGRSFSEVVRTATLNYIAERRLGVNIDKTVRGQIIWRGLDEEVIKYLNKWYGEKGINLISNVKDIDYNYNGEIFTKYYCKPKNTAIVVVEKEEIWKNLREF